MRVLGIIEKIPGRLDASDSEKFKLLFCNYRGYHFALNEDVYRIMLVLDGEVQLLHTKESITLKKGMIEIINPNKIYGVYSENENNLILFLDIEQDIILEYCNGIEDLLQFCINKNDIGVYAEHKLLRDEIENLLYIYVSDREVSLHRCMLIVYKIIDILNEHCKVEIDLDDKLLIKHWMKSELIMFCKKMFENPTDEYSIAYISRYLRSSQSYISKVYKKIFGVGFSESYKLAQLEKSFEILLYEDSNVLETAIKCGFSSSKPFHENYKKYINITPNEFRKKFSSIALKDGKYNNIKNILQSDVVSEILNKSFDKNTINNINGETRTFEVSVQEQGKLVSYPNTYVVSKNSLGENWIENYDVIKDDIKFENILINIKIDDDVYIQEDVGKWRQVSKVELIRLITSLSNLNTNPIISIKIPDLYSEARLSHIEKICEIINEHLSFLILSVPLSVIKNWKLEINMPWVWNVEKRTRNNELEICYKKIFSIFKKYFQQSKMGVNIGDIDISDSEEKLQKMSDIIFKNSFPDFLSYNVVDLCLYNPEMDKICVFQRLSEQINKIIGMVNKIKDKNTGYNPDIYTHSMYMYYNWDDLPEIYWESMFTLSAISGILYSQMTGIGTANIIYYNRFFDDKKDFKKSIKSYFKKFSFVENFEMRNTMYHLYKCISKMGNECLCSQPGLYFVKNNYDYECILYQDMAMCMNHVLKHDISEPFKFTKNKIVINGLIGAYKVITKIFHTKDGTFYNELKKMGSPKYLDVEEKKYLESKLGPTMHIETINVFGKYEREIELDLFEIAYVEIKRLHK